MNTQRSNFTLRLLVQIACAGLAMATLAVGQPVKFVPIEPNQADRPAAGAQPETILAAGDVVEIGEGMVKKIPLSQAPAQLREALSDSQFTEGR